MKSRPNPLPPVTDIPHPVKPPLRKVLVSPRLLPWNSAVSSFFGEKGEKERKRVKKSGCGSPLKIRFLSFLREEREKKVQEKFAGEEKGRTFALQFRGIHEYRNRFFAYGLKIEIKTS